MVVVIILAKIKLAELLHHASTGDSRRPSSDTSPPRGEPHLDDNHCTVGRSYKSQISILEKSPGLFFSTLTSPPPSHPWKVWVIICGQAVRRTVLSCYTAIEPLSNHHSCCVFFVIPFCCFHKSPLSVCPACIISQCCALFCKVEACVVRGCALYQALCLSLTIFPSSPLSWDHTTLTPPSFSLHHSFVVVFCH